MLETGSAVESGVIRVGLDDARVPAADASPRTDAQVRTDAADPIQRDATVDGAQVDAVPGPSCGDGSCDGAESCDTCPDDCGACVPSCGDGTCNGAETCTTCLDDCGACPVVCGDGICDATETCEACADDCGACDWPEVLARSEDELLVLVNQQREVGADCGGQVLPPAAPLRMVSGLREAARAHSLDMGQQNYFDHTGRDGSSFSQRVARTDYQGFAGGENIAAGNGAAQATFNQWLTSPGHCRNMLASRFDEIGVGHAEVRGSQYTHYWTQVLGEGR